MRAKDSYACGNRAAGMRSQRVRAHREERGLGFGDQLFGDFVLATLGRCDPMRELRGEREAHVARLLRQPHTLGGCGDRATNVSAAKLAPGLEYESLS